MPPRGGICRSRAYREHENTGNEHTESAIHDKALSPKTLLDRKRHDHTPPLCLVFDSPDPPGLGSVDFVLLPFALP